MRTPLPTTPRPAQCDVDAPQLARCGCGAASSSVLPRPRQTLGAWIISGGLLLLMPKCPLCLAGYVAMFTGLSISFTAASFLRTGLIILCAATLVCLTAKQFIRQKRSLH